MGQLRQEVGTYASNHFIPNPCGPIGVLNRLRNPVLLHEASVADVDLVEISVKTMPFNVFVFGPMIFMIPHYRTVRSRLRGDDTL